jgi:hypothetical protein
LDVAIESFHALTSTDPQNDKEKPKKKMEQASVSRVSIVDVRQAQVSILIFPLQSEGADPRFLITGGGRIL